MQTCNEVPVKQYLIFNLDFLLIGDTFNYTKYLNSDIFSAYIFETFQYTNSNYTFVIDEFPFTAFKPNKLYKTASKLKFINAFKATKGTSLGALSNDSSCESSA